MARRSTPDRFDEIDHTTSRRGVHRAPRRKGARWIAFAWSALAVGVLTVGGMGFLIATTDTFSIKDFESIVTFPTATPTPTPTPTIAATVDPATTVDVLNATSTAGLAGETATKLTAAGWKVGAKATASTQAATTIIYYVAPGLEGAAKGVVASLGKGTIKLSDQFLQGNSGITVVLGADYVTK